MCNSPSCNHDDLNDDLDGLFDGPAQPLVIAPRDVAPKGSLIDAPMRATVETAAAAAGHRYEEKCTKCRGTGRWSSYSGMTRGECFTCKGKGVLTYKSSPEARAKAADARDRAKVKAEEAKRDGVLGWADANQADWNWLNDAAPRFNVAASMLESLHRWGSLTEKQAAAVTRMRIQSEERTAQWAAEKATRESTKTEVNVDKLAAAFATAKANKLKYPKIRLGGFTFSLASATSANAGAIYVKSETGEYLGKVMQGRFSRSRECPATLEPQIAAAAADPEAAAAAYGLQTGTCSCCGRELTNAESVGLGIGPICRSKWGW